MELGHEERMAFSLVDVAGAGVLGRKKSLSKGSEARKEVVVGNSTGCPGEPNIASQCFTWPVLLQAAAKLSQGAGLQAGKEAIP